MLAVPSARPMRVSFTLLLPSCSFTLRRVTTLKFPKHAGDGGREGTTSDPTSPKDLAPIFSESNVTRIYKPNNQIDDQNLTVRGG
jgi:hypothetical protein